MKSFTRIALLIVVAVSIVACAAAKENTKPEGDAQPMGNQLTTIQVSPEGVHTQVTLNGTEKPVYSVFRMSDPQRIIVDLANTRIGDVPALKEINDGLMTVITTNQYSEAGKPVTRVMIVFLRETEFSVIETETGIIVKLVHPVGYVYPGTAGADTQVAVVEPEVAEPVALAEETIVDETPEPALVPIAAPACTGSDPIVLKAHGGATSAASLTGATVTGTDSGVMLRLATTAPLKDASVEVMRLCEPERMVIDLYGVGKAFKGSTIAGDGVYVEQIRFGKHKAKLRMVLDLAKPLANFDLNFDKKSTSFAFAGTVMQAVAKNAEPVVEEAPEPVVAVVEPTAAPIPVAAAEAPAPVPPMTADGRSAVTGIDFQHRPSSSTIAVMLSGSADYRLVQTADDQIVLELHNTDLVPSLEQTLDTSEFAGPITLISTYLADSETGLVKIAVQLRQAANSHVTMENGQLQWRFDNPEATQLAGSASGRIQVNADGQTVIEYAPDEAAGAQIAPAGSAAAAAQAGTGAAKGQRISLELKNTDILDVLRLIADVSKLNIIAGDDVRGSITVRLLNVPWQQALEIILRSKGLGQERKGNIIRVAPLEKLQREREIRVNQIKAQIDLEPLEVRLIPVSYSDASSLIAKIKDLLSSRGTVNYDERTNVIIVKDIAEVLASAEALIAKLDLQTPQVMIESKIVEADVNNEYGFGIQWGGYYLMSESTGNPTGLSFPSSFGVSGAQSYESSPGLPNTEQPPNWVVNLPTTGTPTGGLGFTFGNVGNTANLSLRLTALESAGRIKIVSSPRISTLDNKEATIEQGLAIPIMSVTVAGVPVSKLVAAKLQLKVTPHITADGSIIMKLLITKQEPDFSRTNSLGDPAIISKEAKTEVLVRTGETTVIGGIYTKRTTWRENRVPLFGRIPILGWLFKNRSVSDAKSELLIFVTPRIINRSQSSLVVE